jgi:hypothetical protein
MKYMADTQLLGELTLYGTGEPYPTLDAVWAKFNHILVITNCVVPVTGGGGGVNA